MVLPKLNELSHETKFLKRENAALKRNTLILKNYYDLLKKDIHELKGSQIFRHVGEHDDRLDEIDEELDDLKVVIEKHSKRIQHCEDLENATEKTRFDDLNATLENHSKRIEKLETLEGAMDNMRIDGNRGDCPNEAEWEDATLTE